MTSEQQRHTARIIARLDRGEIDHATANAQIKASWPMCRRHRRPCPAVDERGRPFCVECAEETMIRRPGKAATRP